MQNEKALSTPRDWTHIVMYGGSAAIGYPPVTCLVLIVANLSLAASQTHGAETRTLG